MKRIAKVSILPLLILTLLTTSFASESPSVIVNNKKLPVKAVYKQSMDKNNRILVPLRAIFESLSAVVDYDHFTKTITGARDGNIIILKVNHNIASVNDQKVELDVPATIFNGNTLVPARFISESLGAHVEWDSATKSVYINLKDEPLYIEGIQAKALQHEYKMTMGGVIRQLENNSYNKSIYDLFIKNMGKKVEAPTHYFDQYNMDILGAYYKQDQYDFLSLKGESIQRFDVYNLVRAYPPAELTSYPGVLIYDPKKNNWYLFNEKGQENIQKLIDAAEKNGFMKTISNTAV